MRLLITLVLALATTVAAAAPEIDLWKRWKQHNPESEKTIDHSAWTAFLKEYVVVGGPRELNRVRYGEVSKADQKALQQYIHMLEGIDIDEYARREQRAYWMNLYNAVVVNLVVQHYPIESIREIDGGLFGNGPWDEKRVTVNGVKLSLNDIEYRILLPIWSDDLTIYGLHKAAVGSPKLLTQAYTGENIERLLHDKGHAYVNSPRGVRFDKAGHLTVSGLYKRHMGAFGEIEAGVITHIRVLAEPALSLRLDAAEGIDNYAYDWSLNDAKGTPKSSQPSSQQQ